MVFSQEDAVLIMNLYLSKGYGPAKLLNEFPEKSWKLDSVKTLLKKVRLTGTTERQKGSGRPRWQGLKTTFRKSKNWYLVKKISRRHTSQFVRLQKELVYIGRQCAELFIVIFDSSA